MSFRSAAAAAVLATLSTTADAAEWPQFRGPNSDNIVTAQNVPLVWGKDKNIAWHVRLPGKGWSSPVLSGGKMYLTTAVVDGPDQDAAGERSLRALCLNPATGRVLWDQEVFRESANSPAIHSKNSHASPTPIVADGRLYVHFGHEGTACLDLEGKKIWEQRTLVYPPVHGGGPSPLLVDGLLIFPCDAAEGPFLAALRAKDGAVAWKTPRTSGAKRNFSFCTPALITLDGKKQVISPASDAIAGYNPENGKELWKIRYDGYSLICQPAFGNGLIYFTTGYDNPVTYAIRPGGSGDMTEKNVIWTQSKRSPNTPSPILRGKELFQVADNGIATCLDALTGEILWQERTARTTSASPLLIGDKLLTIDEFGAATVLRASRTFEKIGENKLDGERVLATPVPDDGALFVRTATGLYRIQEQ
ncbi:MAG: serine/threonine protein kinase [Verrucomicrobiales bacterium]|nr:serine/threonine protein kinase [Verrucomicrobiales bacterium]